MDLEPVKALCETFEIPYHVIPTEIGTVLFDIRKESNPCSLCAKMRVKVLLMKKQKNWAATKSPMPTIKKM